MPLSEREQRLLAQMEQALSAEDPKLVSTFSGSRTRPRPIWAITLALLGMALLLTGLITQVPPVGILGFIAALIGTYLAIGAVRSGISFSGSALHRLETRWHERER